MTQRGSDGYVRSAWGESTAGGWGANAYRDGESAVIHSAAGDFRNFPVESMENKTPLLVHEYGLGTDSGGAGRQRGGLNIVKTYEVLADGIDVSLWFDRTHTPSWGLFGGMNGSVPQVIINPNTPEARQLLKVNHLRLIKGAKFRVASGGGGGYGVPHERPIEQVQEDLYDGYISREAAEQIYRVQLKERTLGIDPTATTDIRG